MEVKNPKVTTYCRKASPDSGALQFSFDLHRLLLWLADSIDCTRIVAGLVHREGHFVARPREVNLHGLSVILRQQFFGRQVLKVMGLRWSGQNLRGLGWRGPSRLAKVLGVQVANPLPRASGMLSQAAGSLRVWSALCGGLIMGP